MMRGSNLVLLVGVVVLAGSCVRPDLHRIVQRDMPAVPASPKLLAVYMPWFGDGGHMNVGYSSQDPAVLHDQVASAQRLGITAFVVDWYGTRQEFLDKSFAGLERAAAQQHFSVALMYDEAEEGDASTERVLEDLDAAYRNYIGPQAPNKDAYLTYQGRPVIFIFPKNSKTDWTRVRQAVNAWPAAPLLFYKDEPPASHADAFDGYYPWIHPGKDQWSKDGSDWGKQYLERFYKTMKSRYPAKIPVGAAWPGFDDGHASWGLDRHMDSRCGKTLEDTLRLFRQYYDSADPLPFLLIETWNDYEEGTAIERPVPQGCPGSAQASRLADGSR